MAMNALMRAYNSFLYQMNSRKRPQIQLEIINLQTIYDYTAFVADPLHESLQSVETGKCCKFFFKLKFYFSRKKYE